ncbi:MAG: hypothetical protein WD969_06240 [Paracoccaceae bacterium]
MTEFTYRHPTQAEIQAIYTNAHRMRAEMIRDAFVATWRAVRSLFVKTGAHGAAGAH